MDSKGGMRFLVWFHWGALGPRRFENGGCLRFCFMASGRDVDKGGREGVVGSSAGQPNSR